MDVVSLGIHGIVLGSFYMFGMKEVFHHKENKYYLIKYGIIVGINPFEDMIESPFLVNMIKNESKEQVFKIPSSQKHIMKNYFPCSRLVKITSNLLSKKFRLLFFFLLIVTTFLVHLDHTI